MCECTSIINIHTQTHTLPLISCLLLFMHVEWRFMYRNTVPVEQRYLDPRHSRHKGIYDAMSWTILNVLPSDVGILS